MRSGDDPMRQILERLMCMEHNLETLRTRVTQVADLRDAQGIREDHRNIVARLNEVEEYASANTLREFMIKLQRLESMLVGENGAAVGEAIRVCNRRIDHQQASLEDVRARIRTLGCPLKMRTLKTSSIGKTDPRIDRHRRRRRGLSPQLRFRSPMP